MDKVRFGRALGYGARHAAKTLSQAVDAATSPGAERAAGRPAATGARSAASRPVASRAVQAARGVQQAKAGSEQLRRSVMAPVKTFSSVLWLQVTGTFFVLVAMSLGGGLWRLRDAVRQPMASREAGEFYICAGMFLLFVYFAVSNFARARKRERLGRR